MSCAHNKSIRSHLLYGVGVGSAGLGKDATEKRAQCDRLREYCWWLSCLQRTEHAFSGLPNNIKQINYFNCSLSSKTIVLDEISVADIGPLPAPLPVPTDTVRYAAKIELGNQLFFDGRLSRNNQVSCAYCHIPGSSFPDPHPHHSVWMTSSVVDRLPRF